MPTPADKPMDLAQATQRIAWLDEERRRDHAETARLAQDVAGMVAAIRDQTVKLRESGDRLNAIEGALARIARLEDTITQARSDMLALRDTDMRLQDEARRHEKDRQVQAEQGARQAAENSARLERIERALQDLANRMASCDSQARQQAERMTDLTMRLDRLGKVVDDVAGRLQLLEARDRDQANRDASIRAQAARLEASQSQAMEDVKRAAARIEMLAADIQQARAESAAALKDEARQREDVASAVAEQKLTTTDLDRRVEDLTATSSLMTTRLEQVEEIAGHYAEALQRMVAIEENLSMLQTMYSALQENEDRHWNTDMPMIQHIVEESAAQSQTNFATNQELVAAAQALREDVRRLQEDLQTEHTFGESLSAALRGLIEEDIQNRLVVAQKQLQSIRRMAQEPVETKTNG